MRFTFFFALPLFAACSSSPDTRQATSTTSAATDTNTAAEPMDTARATKVNAQSDTLKVVRRKHLFSSPSSPDQFMLTLRGTNLLSAEASFTITDASGQVIFREVLTAPDLEASMVYEMQGSSATQAEREAFVKKRMEEFFADKNFQKPALAKSERYQPGQLDRATWDDLQRRPDATSFRYLVGKEETRRIAWSPLKKQVVKLGSTGG
ncbi:hypothetical protein [Hymenobacter sp. GOD-10R]|uniref:hypothetical protein n=1 Tax=Hymenobacter sp. GOD-10R TaxID=3093922 RepID=UPI002D774570|nr:hypothetical protein [Hymenobacter sp. GOD-10R]WRQ29670.1 hypothetical protein SD425_05265 [Hymenobacter sp. GOD-10R]